MDDLNVTACIFAAMSLQAPYMIKFFFLLSIVSQSQRFIILILSLINLEVSSWFFCLGSFHWSLPYTHFPPPLESVVLYLRTGQVKYEGNMFKIHTN